MASAKFKKTSLQISPEVLSNMTKWRGLSQSEALRLCIERGHYLSSLSSETVSFLIRKHTVTLREALTDLGYDDYRIAARALPQIVQEAFHGKRTGKQHEALTALLESLSAPERISILDHFTAERHRP